MDGKTSVVLALVAIAVLNLGCGGESAPKSTREASSARDLPAAVSESIAKSYPDAVIQEVESEVEDGKTVYAVELIVGGKELEIEVSDDGEVLEVEQEEDDADDGHDEDADDEDDEEDKKGKEI